MTPGRAKDDPYSPNDYVRILLVLDAAENAHLTPISAPALQGIAYLSNVLTPLWNLLPYEGAILKEDAPPYYPELQQDLDAMVGLGLVEVVKLKYSHDSDGRWRFAGSFAINHSAADEALHFARALPEYAERISFLRELAFALSSLDPDSLPSLAANDANYLNSRTGVGNVVDFAEWERRNYGAAAAKSFSVLSQSPVTVSRGEQLNLYVRHLDRMLQLARRS